MITFILNNLFDFLKFLLNIFPVSSGFPESVHTAFQFFGGYVGLIDVLVPVSVMLWCISTIYLIEITLFGFKTILWFKTFIPFMNHGNSQIK